MGQTTLCTEPECGRATIARDLCWRHYQRLRRSGSFTATVVEPPRVVPQLFVERKSRRAMELRFWEKVKTDGACWLWQGSTTGSLNYGQFRGPSGKPEFAHRVSWQIAYGPIPTGLLVLHRCDVPRCVRPDHLYLGDHADNSRDAAESQRVRRHRDHRTPENLERVGDTILSVRFSDALLMQLDALTREKNLSRSEVIRVAVALLHEQVMKSAA